MRTPFDVLLDGDPFVRSSFGGTVRYTNGIAEGLWDAGLDVALLLDCPPKPPARHVPRIPFAHDVSARARWWLTDDPARLDLGSADRVALIVHDLMAFDPLLSVPIESAATIPLAEFTDACSRADLVIAVSNSTRARLVDLLPSLEPPRLCTVPHGLALALWEPDDRPTRQDFILHVGGRSGYKRFDLLMEAVASMDDVNLVSVGGRAKFSEDEKRLIARLGLTGRIQSLGYVEDPTLVRLYREARLVAVTSDQEGYGLPMREAVALGAPVVAPDIDVAYEVCGDAAHVFTPGDSFSLARALQQAWTQPKDVPFETVDACRAGWEKPSRTLIDAMSAVESTERVR
jgi:glycosyltransferase involved in cell wall biosynthesis